MPVSEWDADMFVSYVKDQSSYDGEIDNDNLAKLFNIKNGQKLPFEGGASGYFDDKNYNKYKSWTSALYDVFDYLMTTI